MRTTVYVLALCAALAAVAAAPAPEPEANPQPDPNPQPNPDDRPEIIEIIAPAASAQVSHFCIYPTNKYMEV
jgi:hypothetical protein